MPEEHDKTEQNQPDEYYVQALLLAEVVKRILDRKGDVKLSDMPILELKPITEFVKRMRATSVGKFEGKAYIATINFYRDQKSLEMNQVVGTLILYLPEEQTVWLLQKLEYPDVDEDDEAVLKDACGAFCNLIAGNFKNGLTQLGYEDLIMSHFTSYVNDVFEGVLYPLERTDLYEIAFKIREQKSMVFELVMGDVPKAYELNLSYFK